mmetsp:Transcript_17357/g.24883  ORF Transcript_17357/g.24883 Transcript_17357/m.24883 type:complete len:83 (+) Transcript_17357:845-1093(+)
MYIEICEPLDATSGGVHKPGFHADHPRLILLSSTCLIVDTSSVDLSPASKELLFKAGVIDPCWGSSEPVRLFWFYLLKDICK